MRADGDRVPATVIIPATGTWLIIDGDVRKIEVCTRFMSYRELLEYRVFTKPRPGEEG